MTNILVVQSMKDEMFQKPDTVAPDAFTKFSQPSIINDLCHPQLVLAVYVDLKQKQAAMVFNYKIEG